MNLILVRHGESEANFRGISQSAKDEWSDTILTKKGIEQAGKLAERLRFEKIDYIYCSDLKRAKQTANKINKFHNLNIIFDKQIRDVSKHETLEDIIGRAKSFLRDVEKKDGNILVVCHGGICLTLLAITTGSREKGGKLVNKYKDSQKNTCVNIVEKVHGKYKIKLIGCIKHLT